MKRRIARWSVAAAICGGGVWLAAAGAQQVAGCDTATFHRGATGVWATYPAPAFSAGEQQITAQAVDPKLPYRWFVTNGTVIEASSDNGCHWRETYVLPQAPTPDMPLDRDTGEIHALSAGGKLVLATVTGAKPSTTPTVPIPPLPLPGPEGGKDTTLTGMTVVLSSADDGATWKAAQSPIPEADGGPGPIVQAPTQPTVVYVGSGMAIARSTDGGQTFGAPALLAESNPPGTAQVGKGDVSASGSIQAIGVDPNDPVHVIVRAPSAIWQTTDGSNYSEYASPRQPNGPSGKTLVGPALTRGSGASSERILFTVGDESIGDPRIQSYYVSDDGGNVWARHGTDDFGRVPGIPLSVTGGDARDDVVITTDQTVGRWNPKAGKFVGVDEFHLGPLYGAIASGADPSTFSFFQPRRLVRWYAPPGGRGSLPTSYVGGDTGDSDAPLDGTFKDPPIPPDDLAGPEGTLTPDHQAIHIPVGGSVAQDYAVRMPQRPGRLDTFFLLDTSSSTNPYILSLEDGLQGLSHALSDANVDGWFGYGEYQDVTPSGVRYRRRAAIRPADDYLHQQLDTTRPSGGESEPGYTAIDQAVTGSGIKVGQLDQVRYGYPVPPGQDARWRRASTRLIFHVADEPFGDDPLGPKRDTVVAHLLAAHTQFMGIVINTGDPLAATDQCALQNASVPKPPTSLPGGTGSLTEKDFNTLKLRCQMEDLARATKTFAPEGGVDCDGDGTVDIKAGDPLICVLPEGSGSRVAGMADAMKRLLLSVKFPQPVSVGAADGTKVKVDVTAGGDYSALDLRANHDLAFHVVYSCPTGTQGHDYDIDLQARVDTLPFAHAHPHVYCAGVAPAVVPPRPKKAAPVPPKKPAPAPAVAAAAQPQPVLAFAPIPPPPPARVPVPQSAPAQAPQPGQATSQVTQTQQAPSPVSMTAEQKQESPTVQKVQIDDSPGPGDATLNFARADSIDGVRHDDWWSAMLLRTLGLGAVVGLGAAAARKRDRAPQVRRAHNRR